MSKNKNKEKPKVLICAHYSRWITQIKLLCWFQSLFIFAFNSKGLPLTRPMSLIQCQKKKKPANPFCNWFYYFCPSASWKEKTKLPNHANPWPASKYETECQHFLSVLDIYLLCSNLNYHGHMQDTLLYKYLSKQGERFHLTCTEDPPAYFRARRVSQQVQVSIKAQHFQSLHQKKQHNSSFPKVAKLKVLSWDFFF